MKKLLSYLLPLLVLPFIMINVNAKELIPGGQVIGLALQDGSLTVVSIHETLGKNALAAGLKSGDRLCLLNGQAVKTTDQVRTALAGCGDRVTLTINRDGKQQDLTLCPTATSEGPRLGIYLKEGITGIGTVTYYDPQTGTYGALGHGVTHKDGTAVTMDSGKAYKAAILSVHKGTVGKPGQLAGTLAAEIPIGTVDKAAHQGIFGKLPCPSEASVPTGDAKIGKATIRSTVDTTGIQEYSVEILKIYPHGQKNGRNMLIKITDEALLAATGGIVQGMSGSPIIQDGKLVGAVTHVLVNDPTTGYGIFIENMLDAAA